MAQSQGGASLSNFLVRQAYSRKAAAKSEAAPAPSMAADLLTREAPAMGMLDCVGTEVVPPVPTGTLVVVVQLSVGTGGPAWTFSKLAHEMRVLLAKCRTKLRLPKKPGSVLRVEA